MTRCAGWVVASALGLATWCGAAAQAAENVLAIVPSDALAVGLVKNISDADAKVQKLAGLVQSPIPSPLAQLKSMAGIQKGLDEKGTVVAIVQGGNEDERPDVVVAVPVTDYKEFVGQFHPTDPDARIVEVEAAGSKTKMLVAHRGGFALLEDPANRKWLEKVLDAHESIAGELAPIEPWLAENDAAFVGTRAGIRWATAKAQAELKKTLQDFKRIEDAGGMPGGDPLGMALAVLQFYGQGLALAEKEVSLAAVGVAVDQQNTVRVTGRVRFVKDSKVGESLAAIQPADKDLMAGLPGGPFFFAGGAVTPEPLMKQLAALGTAFLQKNFSRYGLSPEQAEQLAKNSMQTLEQMRTLSLVMKTGKRGEPIYSNMFGTIRVANAPQYLAQYEKQMEAQNRILKEAKDGILKPMEVKKTEIGGRPALEVEVTIPLPKTDGEGPMQEMQQSMMQAMFGPNNKMKIYLTAANETTLVMGYGTTPEKVGEASEMVRSAKPGFAADKDVAATAALLPAGAQWVGYVSPHGYVNMVRRMMEVMMAGMQDRPGFSGAPAIPAFPQTPPVGMALKATSGGLEASLVVPSAVLKAISEYAATIRQTNMNPQIP
jgi:hypothetical protein